VSRGMPAVSERAAVHRVGNARSVREVVRPRIAVALAVALFAALTLGSATQSISPAASASATTPAPCTPTGRCSTHGISATTRRPAAEPCLRSASCGGGALLSGGGVVVLAVLSAEVAPVAPSLGRRIAAVHEATSAGRVTAGRLYRPPRLSL
jgi:hypothetical protein